MSGKLPATGRKVSGKLPATGHKVSSKLPAAAERKESGRSTAAAGRVARGELPVAAERALQEYIFNLGLVRGASPRTVAAYESDLRALFARLAERSIAGPAQVEETHLRSYLIEMHERGRQPATVARARAAIRSLFAFLLDEGIVPADPTRELEAPSGWRRIPRALSLEEVTRLIESVSGRGPVDLRDRALLECAYGTGARVSELLALRPAACRLRESLVRLDGKGGRTRLVPLGGPAKEALRDYIEHGRSELARHRRRGQPPEELFLNARGTKLSRMGFWKILSRRAAAAGLSSRVHPHVLRHTYATHLLRGGAALRAVQELLGHARLATTQIYTSVDDAYLQDMHRRYHPRG